MKDQVLRVEGESGDFIPRYHDHTFGHGVIGLANESKIVEGNYQRPLTDFAVGFLDNSDLVALSKFIAPWVPVSRRFEYAKFPNAEAFLSDAADDDLRPVGGDFKRIEFTANKASGVTDNRGLTMCLDRDQYDGSAAYEELMTMRMVNRLARNRCRRALAKLVAIAVATSKTWDTTAGKDPDKDVKTELVTGASLSGVRNNRALYGDTAWDKRELSHRAQTSAGGFASATATEQQMASTLGVGRVLVDRTRYQSSASAKSELVGAKVLMFAGMDDPTPADFTTIKTFVSNTRNGAPMRVFRKEEEKYVEITVEAYDLIDVMSSLGVRLLNIS